VEMEPPLRRSRTGGQAGRQHRRQRLPQPPILRGAQRERDAPDDEADHRLRRARRCGTHARAALASV
jgi:hypothetical protein